jgi:hypothetical protein
MARFRTWTTSTEAGELAPEYALRTDQIVRNKGLLKARNIRLLSGGGWSRRWGTRRKVSYTNDCRLETFGVGESRAVQLAFSPGRLDIYDESWTLLQSITSGCPWTLANIHTMQVAAEANRITVTSRDFFTKEISKAGAVYSIADKTWAPGRGGSLRQPYYRFQLPGVTLTPSGTSGTGITLTASAAHFSAGHVGSRIRYQGEEILVTGFTSATVVTGNVVGALYPTLTVPIVTSAGFQIGDVVEGEDSKVQGLVVGVPSGTSLTVLLTGGYEFFIGGTTNENLVGPNMRSKLTGACTATTPAASVDWDEALLSPVRGYPAAVGYHRGRQLLADFPQAPNLLAASISGDPDDFDVGEAGPNDAVVETVGRDDTLRIRFIGSMEQLLLFTDAGAFYVPETTGAPFSPTNAEFLLIGPEAIGNTPPVRVSEGMLFCEARSGRMLVCIPTGNVRRSWDVADLSELSFHLMGQPKKIVVLPAVNQSDREIVILKEDGTIAWMRYRRGQDVTGWALWTTQGEWRSLTVVDGRLYLVAKRFANGATVYWGEELDPTATLDGCVSSASATWLHLANTAVTVTKDRQTIWQGNLSNSGNTIASDTWWGSVDAGFPSTVEVEYPPPIDGENGQMRLMSIIKAMMAVFESGSFRADGYELGAFMPESAEDALPPLWSDTREHWVPGFEWARTLKITQEIPAPLTMRALTLEVKS